MTTTSIAELKAFLDSEQVPAECYDYLQTHGFLCALAVSPEALPRADWLAEIYGGPVQFSDAALQQRIEASLQQLLDSLSRTLYSGEAIALPCALQLGKQPDHAPLRGWALGFMEGLGLQEERWFAHNEEEVGELLLPFVLAAGLFDDPELQKLSRDAKQSRELLERIPANLSELYLLLREESSDEDEAN